MHCFSIACSFLENYVLSFSDWYASDIIVLYIIPEDILPGIFIFIIYIYFIRKICYSKIISSVYISAF